MGNPDLAADVATSAKITVDGMSNGRFTGVALSDYINGKKTDLKNARAVVNGETSKNGERIARYARSYLDLEALEGSGIPQNTQLSVGFAYPASRLVTAL